jgi:hypothetical protein
MTTHFHRRRISPCRRQCYRLRRTASRASSSARSRDCCWYRNRIATGIVVSTSETKHQREVRRSVRKVRQERGLAWTAIDRLRIGLIEESEEFFRGSPGLTGNVGHRLTVLFGVGPPIAAAIRKRLRQSSLRSVMKADSSEPSVLRFAIVVLCVMLIGSKQYFAPCPGRGSTRLGTLPAAIFNPPGLPEIDSPLMNRAPVNAEATVVSSLITTFAGGVWPGTDSRSPAELLLWAIVYRMASALTSSWLVISNRPSVPVVTWASCLGSPLLAARSVTVEFASGRPVRQISPHGPGRCPHLRCSTRDVLGHRWSSIFSAWWTNPWVYRLVDRAH